MDVSILLYNILHTSYTATYLVFTGLLVENYFKIDLYGNLVNKIGTYF